MAIRCAGCGREYDVTLFQFGRTIRCECGQVVSIERGHELHLQRQDGSDAPAPFDQGTNENN